MAKLEPKVVVSHLRDMRKDLLKAKSAVEEMEKDVEDTKPEDLVGEDTAGPDEFNFQDKGEAGPDEDEGVEKETGEKEEKGKHKIENVGDAKKVIDEAKEDLTEVVDALDGLVGANEDEEKKASIKRWNDRYASNLNDLSIRAQKALGDAKASMKHWAFILNRKNVTANIKTPGLKQTLETVKEAQSVWQQLGTIFGHKKQSTNVPPTGSEFSGDKWPNGKNPAEVELRAWNSGADEFKRDKAKYDKLPNAAVDDRLTDEANPHDDKPHVNASFVYDPMNKFASYWDVIDTKTGRRVVADFNNVPASLSPNNRKGENEFIQFSSEDYGKKIASTVIEDGIESVRSMLSGHYVNAKEASLLSQARDPKIKDKAKVRKYYADMYGDKPYAKDLTSAQKTAKEDGVDGGMRVDYTPADEHPSEKNKEHTKDGPGKISAQDPTVILARTERAVEVARKFAACGAFPFTKEAIKNKARQLMQMNDVAFKIAEKTIDELPIVNEAALKEAHIPDTEKGIVGDTKTGVSDPKSKVETEDINATVKSDAKIAKQASIVPQMQDSAPMTKDFTSSFNTTANRLGKMGIDINQTKIMKPRYRQG